jgi:PAS domain-containing protein
MCDLRSYDNSTMPGVRAMKASGDGFWELNLADGSTWFSEWFYDRLQWPDRIKRSTFEDLRPSVSAETWDLLLGQLRDHLEQQIPLDAEFPVTLADGRMEWWQLRGSAQLNQIGHPIHVAGSVRDVTGEPRKGT